MRKKTKIKSILLERYHCILWLCGWSERRYSGAWQTQYDETHFNRIKTTNPPQPHDRSTLCDVDSVIVPLAWQLYPHTPFQKESKRGPPRKMSALWNQVGNVQHAQAKGDLLPRMTPFAGLQVTLEVRRMESYAVTDQSEKEALPSAHKNAFESCRYPENLRWEGNNPARNVHEGDAQYEVDLYLRIESSSHGTTLGSILRDVCDEVVYFNPSSALSKPDGQKAMEQVLLTSGDEVWMEIAETPKSLRGKLWQLERAFRHFKQEGNNRPPNVKAFIVCLNGEREKFTIATSKVRDLNTDKAFLKNWEIFSHNIPVFAIFTPYRNVYGALHEVNAKIDKLIDKVNAKIDKLAFVGIAGALVGIAGMALGFGTILRRMPTSHS